MNDIRYEPVFGDQTWFDDGPDDAEMMAIYALRLKRWYKLQDGECYSCIGKGQPWERCSNGCPGLPLRAQRRIIRTPTWTKADQQAGKLPEVGAEVMCMDDSRHNFVGESIHAGHWALCHGKTKKVFHIPDTAVMPVETDAERQQCEREEWCRKALDSAKISDAMQRYEIKRLGEYIGSIHDALLSGELKMPEVQK